MSSPVVAPGSPLPPASFRGRQQTVDQICQHLLGPERLSASVVGGPRTGKTSLLRYLASKQADSLLPGLAYRVYFDAQLLSSKAGPQDFWVGVLRELKASALPAALGATVNKKLSKDQLDSYDLEDVFDPFAQQGATVVVLVDNFEVVLYNSNFWGDFFHLIRFIGQRTPRGMAWVLGTQRMLLDLWADHLGSVYYNIFATFVIGRLSEDDCRDFVRQALKNANLAKNAPAEDLVIAASDTHPFLVNLVTALVVRQLTGPGQLDQAAIGAALRDPNGEVVSLIRQVRAALSPSERLWLDNLRSDPKQVTDAQRSALARLRDYGLLPPGTKL